MTYKVAIALTTLGLALSGCLGSETSKLTVGECVEVDAVGFTFGGNVDSASCADIDFFNDIYRVRAVGSESEVDRVCGFGGLVIVDDNDAACLEK